MIFKYWPSCAMISEIVNAIYFTIIVYCHSLHMTQSTTMITTYSTYLYFREVGELVVSIIQARGLEPDQVTGTLDSYVKLWLTPGHPNK